MILKKTFKRKEKEKKLCKVLKTEATQMKLKVSQFIELNQV